MKDEKDYVLTFKNLPILIGLVIIGLYLSAIGNNDYEDEKQQEKLYCEMVESGAWGDYEGNFNEVCLDSK